MPHEGASRAEAAGGAPLGAAGHAGRVRGAPIARARGDGHKMADAPAADATNDANAEDNKNKLKKKKNEPEKKRSS